MMYKASDFSDSRPIQKAGSVVKWSVLLICAAALQIGCTPTGTGGSISPSSATSNPNTVVLSGRYEVIGIDGGVHGGIVKDLETDLEWMRCSLGQTWDGNACTGDASTHTWNDAQTQAESTSYGGHSDWRVPELDELRTLVYCSSGEPDFFNDSGDRCNGSYDRPTIVQEAFPDTSSSDFWSASPYAGRSVSAWFVNFNSGYDNWYYKSYYGRVRLVRGGQ